MTAVAGHASEGSGQRLGHVLRAGEVIYGPNGDPVRITEIREASTPTVITPVIAVTTSMGAHTCTWRMPGTGRHRVDGPAEITTQSGRVTSRRWFHNNRRHRTDGGPAVFQSTSDGAHFQWFKDDEFHRLDGPDTAGSDGFIAWQPPGAEVISVDKRWGREV